MVPFAKMDAAGATAILTPVTSSDASGTSVRSLGGLVAANGDLYWADTQSHAIRRLSAAGDLTTVAGIDGSAGSEDGAARTARFNFPDGSVTTLAALPGAPGSNDGAGSAARFDGPVGLAVDDAGAIYVADAGNCVVRKVSAAGRVTTVAGSAGACDVFIGGALPGALHRPRRVALKGNDLYIGMRHGIAVVRDAVF